MKKLIIQIIILIIASTCLAQSRHQVYSPKYSIMAGTYTKDLQLHLNTETSGGIIYYMTDGSTPDTSSQIYSKPFSIEGDGTTFYIKAITYDNSASKYSEISSSYYKIDYSYDSTMLINLDINDYQHYLEGHWIGYGTNPYEQYIPNSCWNIDLKVSDTGHYSAHSISGIKYVHGDEVFYPAFMFDFDEDHPDKKITVKNVDSLGIASGDIVIRFWDGNTATMELRSIKLFNKGNILNFEYWYISNRSSGPFNYCFTRLSNSVILGSVNNLVDNIVLYPNPVKDEINIKIYDSKSEYYIEIFDITGKKMHQGKLQKDQSKINVNELPNGMYYLSISNKSGNKYTSKFIKIE